MLNKGGVGGVSTVITYAIAARRINPLTPRRPASRALPSNLMREWFETNIPAEPGQTSRRVQSSRAFLGGTVWLKEHYSPTPGERYPLVGERKATA